LSAQKPEYLELSHKYKRVIVLISDLHVGSRYAPFPPTFKGARENQPFGLNQGQITLNQYFFDFVDICKELKADTVFLVGDIMGGYNPKDPGMYLLTSDLDEQCMAAYELLKPLCKGRQVGVWAGTPYHGAGTENIKIHKQLADMLNGRFFGRIANIKLVPSERIVNIAHRGTSAPVYPETAMARDMLFFQQAEALKNIPFTVDIIVRAHMHRWIYIHKYQKHYLMLPGWEAFIPYYMATRWYSRYLNPVGGAVLLIDDKDRIRVWHYLYPPVHIADALKEA